MSSSPQPLEAKAHEAAAAVPRAPDAEALGPELLALILALLSPEDVLRARCVCRAWRTIAEYTIARRNVRDGPFIVLGADENVPVGCTLPLFTLTHAPSLAHPAVARADTDRARPLTMAPAMRRKLLTLVPRAKQDGTHFRALHGGSDAFPRATFLDEGADGVPPDSRWPRVSLFSTQRSVSPRLLATMALCRTVTCAVFGDARHAGLAAPAQIRNVALHDGVIRADVVPRDVQVLALSDITLNGATEAVDLLTHMYRSGVHCVTDHVFRTFESSPNALYLPALHDLQWHFGEAHAAIFAKSLKTLSMCGDEKTVYLDTDCVALESLHLSQTRVSIGWLGYGFPLRELVLYDVLVYDLDFLAGCAGTLETLELSHLVWQDPKVSRALPAAMPRLKRLVLVFFAAGTLADSLARFTSLEELTLDTVPDVTEVTWIARLEHLRTLTLAHLHVDSLDGLQHLQHLETLIVRSNAASLSVAPLAHINSLRRLTLDNCSNYAFWPPFDLGDSPVTRLFLRGIEFDRVAGPRAAVLPRGLRSLVMQFCVDPWDLLAANPLRGLRRLSVLSTQAPAALPAHLGPLTSLAMDLRQFRAGALDYVVAEHLALTLEGAAATELQGVRAASLSLSVYWPDTRNFSLTFLDPATLRRLHLTLPHNVHGLSLAPLRACVLLEECRVSAANLTTLHALTGHPALREFGLSGGFDAPLDAAALLTCPRLLVADITEYTLPPGQEDRLEAYLEQQIQ